MPASLHQSVTKTQKLIAEFGCLLFLRFAVWKGCLFFFNTRGKNVGISHIDKEIGQYAFGFWSTIDATKNMFFRKVKINKVFSFYFQVFQWIVKICPWDKKKQFCDGSWWCHTHSLFACGRRRNSHWFWFCQILSRNHN